MEERIGTADYCKFEISKKGNMFLTDMLSVWMAVRDISCYRYDPAVGLGNFFWRSNSPVFHDISDC